MSPESQTPDFAFEQTIYNRLNEHGLLEVSDLEMRVRQGIAYIKGFTANLKQKRQVGEIASQVEGIRDVVNMLRVTPLPVMDDRSLEKHIRRTLSRNPRIEDAGISVEVLSGRVYLSGFVKTADEKRLIENEIWAVPGITNITNRIKVLSAPFRSEAQCAGEILQGFSDCLGLDLSRISVDFRDGVVHLRGTVPTDYLKEAAEELASWTPSVTRVVNELEVQELPESRRYTPPGLAGALAEDCSRNTGTTDSKAFAAGGGIYPATTRSSSNASKATN